MTKYFVNFQLRLHGFFYKSFLFYEQFHEGLNIDQPEKKSSTKPLKV